MKTLTVRNIPDDVTALLQANARSAGASMNSTVVRILAEGVRPRKKRRQLNDFSKYCGGWSQEEFDKFEAAVSECEKIDEESWK
jgi:plasmid stability protein